MIEKSNRNLTVGILRETKDEERRAPLTPSDVKWLSERGISVEVERSPDRIFGDKEYQRNGAKLVDRVEKADCLIGIKGPKAEDLLVNKIYMVFSHTTKGQAENMPLLKACLDKKVTLIDYEKIVNNHGKRLVYFGRFAGICGMVDSLHYFGKKLEWKGISNPFLSIKPSYEYDSLEEIKQVFLKMDQEIQRTGFPEEISPFIIGITGHGNVSRGVQEILNILNPLEIHPKDMVEFISHQKGIHNKLYKIIFFREEKLRSKDGKGFYFEEYLKEPERFESNMDQYLPHLNILIHTSYWDKRYPRIVDKKMINKLAKEKPFRLEFIGDISCDINGSIELTYKEMAPSNPTFTYIPENETFIDGYKSEGITVLAVSNLPAELPKDASGEFSSLIKDYVYQVASHGVKDVTQHVAIPIEMRRSVITQGGDLTERFRYLRQYASR